jgi:hypothetical protein
MFNFIFGYILWMGAIVVGQFMRGPSWFFFWPWEPWDVHAQRATVLFKDIPTNIGLISLAVYFGLWYLGPIILRLNIYKKLDITRYLVLTTLMALMYAVPIKIIMRQIFHIKYVLVTPWFNI